ncbi:MAG TPA: CCA tRNA nucleotidyltransferase [Desulfurococcales archaeon]|nr:CCA tRNA nucleotidyltransferase [Desulfurococcales archaeon]
MKDIEREVLERIKPSKEEYVRAQRIFDKVKELLERTLNLYNIDATVELEGSIAKDTWISGEWDLDVFVLFNKHYGTEWIKTKGFKIIYESVRNLNPELRYAEHPYVRVKVEGFDVDIVPALRLERASEAKTVVDRTPFHTRYVKSKLTSELRDQVRLLKKFMKGIGVYGAEIKVRGFSGYLCELLVIAYGGFRRVLENVRLWKPRQVIDIEKHYRSLREAVRKFRDNILIVIDPVDPNRNVAAAVSLDSFSKLIVAANLYLKKPSIKFFYPPVESVDCMVLKRLIKNRKTSIVALVTQCPSIPPDTLWGELGKSLKALCNYVARLGFKIIDSSVWSDESNIIVFLLELLDLTLHDYEKHYGPPVHIQPNMLEFLKKYINSEDTIAGPWVENGRLVVLKKRRMCNIIECLSNVESYVQSLSPHIRECILNKLDILVDIEILTLARKHNEFKYHLYRFLRKREPWIT